MSCTVLVDPWLVLNPGGLLIGIWLRRACWLMLHADFVDVRFTAKMEDTLDQIAAGTANRTEYLTSVSALK